MRMMQEFKKTDKQNLATKMATDPLLVHFMLIGGSRSGKTFDHVRRVFIRAAKTPSRHLMVRNKFNHIKVSVWHETIPKVLSICFPDLNAVPNKTDYYYKLPNGSEVWIAGLDEGDRTEKVLGKEYSTIYFNECSTISLASRNMALTRLAEDSKLRNIAYYDANPPSKKHWTYWLWVKLFDPVSEEPLDSREYQSLLMNPADNISNIDPDYIEKILNKMPEKEKQRFLLGQFTDSDDGLAYYEFDRDKHVTEFTRDDLLEIAERSTLCVGMDFNVDPMTAVVGYYTKGVFYVTDEVWQNNSDTPRMCDELIKRKYYGCNVYPDSTGSRRQTGGKTDFKELVDRGFTLKGIRNPYQVDRVNNLNRLLKNGKIVIDKKCKKLIRDLEMVSWKNNELDKKAEDGMLTHISDSIGYWTWALDNIVYNGRKSSTIQL
jgi:PBSX family phage terminase large subunit